MPRKQRFKPSRKPKPIEPVTDANTTNENKPQDTTRTPAVLTTDTTPTTGDVGNET